MAEFDALVQTVTATVLQKSKYNTVQTELVTRLAQRELAKGRKQKEAIKEVSAKLHQIGGAYFKLAPRYAQWQTALQDLPDDAGHEDVRAYCLEIMQSHNSTAERLPILEPFFSEILSPLAPIESVFDLACGLNPLALPWIPLAANAYYYGCDIFSDLITFNNAFLQHFHIQASLETADIFTYKFQQPVKLALLLKCLPCLEQLEKGRGAELMEAIPADYLLVSYPIHSLGGRSKGMRQTYSAQFDALTEGKGWKISRYEFSSELVFLVKK